MTGNNGNGRLLAKPTDHPTDWVGPPVKFDDQPVVCIEFWPGELVLKPFSKEGFIDGFKSDAAILPRDDVFKLRGRDVGKLVPFSLHWIKCMAIENSC